MTREDIDNIISIICPNDEDFEKPIISPAYLKKELETLALEQEPSGETVRLERFIKDLMDKETTFNEWMIGLTISIAESLAVIADHISGKEKEWTSKTKH